MDPETREWLQRLFTGWSFAINPLVEAIAFVSILVPRRPAMPAAIPAAMPAADEGQEELAVGPPPDTDDVEPVEVVWPDTDDSF